MNKSGLIKLIKNSEVGTILPTDITTTNSDATESEKEYTIKCINEGIGRVILIRNTTTQKEVKGIIEDIDFETNKRKRYIVFTENGEYIDTLYDAEWFVK